MKKILILIILIISLFLTTACENKNNSQVQKNNSNIKTPIPNQYYSTGTNDTENNQQYFTNNNKNYYLVGINGIEVSFKNIKLVKKLPQALDENLTSIDNMITKANNQEKIYNGIIYHYDTFSYAQCDNNDNYFLNININKNICN